MNFSYGLKRTAGPGGPAGPSLPFSPPPPWKKRQKGVISNFSLQLSCTLLSRGQFISIELKSILTAYAVFISVINTHRGSRQSSLSGEASQS